MSCFIWPNQCSKLIKENQHSWSKGFNQQDPRNLGVLRGHSRSEWYWGLNGNGHKTSPQQTISPRRPRTVGCTTTGLAPKKPRSLKKPESYRETLISIRAPILQYHLDHKSEENQCLVLSEIGKVSHKTPMWQHPLLQSHRLARSVLICVCVPIKSLQTGLLWP